MTEADAIFEIQTLTCATQYPLLSAAQAAMCLKRARRADRFNRAPSDSAWLPTYDLPYAVALGWEQKAANSIAGDANNMAAIDVKAGDEMQKRSQTYDQCMAQAKSWKAKGGIGSIQIVGPDPLELPYYLNAGADGEQIP